jgi:hypothetical protein
MWSSAAPAAHVSIAISLKKLRFCPSSGSHHRKTAPGSDDADNLCLCCIRCNLKKGPNIASIDPETGLIVALFHPRRHSWREHLSLGQDGRLQGLTPEGRVTVQLMEMNDMERVSLRSLLLRRGLYP